MGRKTKPILLIEDHGDFRTAIKTLLELEGYGVVSVANGEVAFEALRAGLDPGLILLDVNMPGKDGVQFRAEQLSDPALAQIPVVMYSGAANIGETAAALGVTAFFHKPVEIEQLLELVRRHCQRPQPEA